MIAVTRLFDAAVKKILTALCSVLLLLMVAFTVYSVVMRYVFETPPVWGDVLTVLRNFWLVFLALALTGREKDHIALDLLYSWLPLKAVFVIQQFWALVIFGVGLIMIIYGWEAVTTMGSKYWEMWYFAWEDGQIVFKPNYMPKKYAIAIVPISGFLVSVAALASIIEDSLLLKAGAFKRVKGVDLHAEADQI
jgi:TRAP-type C4-dicarboxylate transport system permease small subunit